ncbi:MFS transporter [Sphingobium amiense]|nr:MFS transporter [Sphingobium amiense]
MINRRSPYYPWLLLTVLSLAYLCASIDRIVISLLVEPIKADLDLTDTQISLLLGLAFVLLFSIAGIPMGMLVDRVDRMRLLAWSAGVWSVMTALCGLAGGFWMLFVARAGVGVGEAALTPAGYSLISDAFEKKRLGLALGIFTTGGAIGTGVSLVVGGYAVGELSRHGDFVFAGLGSLHPWQLTLIVLALPGLVLAAIIAMMPQPARLIGQRRADDPASSGALAQFYRDNQAMLARHHLASGLCSMVLLAGYSWIAALFARVHGWQPADVGFAVGIVSIIGAPAGLLGGGMIGDGLIHKGPHIRLVVCAVSVALAAIFGLIYPLVQSPAAAILAFGAMALFATVPMGVGNAVLQHVVPGEIRGLVSAIYSFCLSMIGMAGPTLIAGIADLFFPFPTGMRYATALVVPAGLVAAALLWLWTIPPYRRLIRRIDAQDAAPVT